VPPAAFLQETLVGSVAAAPDSVAPIDAVIAVFKVTFETWVDADEKRDLPQVIRDSRGWLRTVTG
jgi:hypothetical protein